MVQLCGKSKRWLSDRVPSSNLPFGLIAAALTHCTRVHLACMASLVTSVCPAVDWMGLYF